MSWFLLGDVPHTRRRGIVMCQRYICPGMPYPGRSRILAEAIQASLHWDPKKKLETVRVAASNPKSITFEVWQMDPGTLYDDPLYNVFYVVVPVDDELLGYVCEGDLGRGMKRNWNHE